MTEKTAEEIVKSASDLEKCLNEAMRELAICRVGADGDATKLKECEKAGAKAALQCQIDHPLK